MYKKTIQVDIYFEYSPFTPVLSSTLCIPSIVVTTAIVSVDAITVGWSGTKALVRCYIWTVDEYKSANIYGGELTRTETIATETRFRVRSAP